MKITAFRVRTSTCQKARAEAEVGVVDLMLARADVEAEGDHREHPEASTSSQIAKATYAISTETRIESGASSTRRNAVTASHATARPIPTPPATLTIRSVTASRPRSSR